MNKKILLIFLILGLLINLGCSQFSTNGKYKLPSVEDYCNVGRSFYSQAKYDVAAACYEEALKLDPNYKDAKDGLYFSWYAKGFRLAQEKKYIEAIEYYNKAIYVDSTNYVVWENKGHALYNLGRDGEAQVCYDEAKRLRALYNK
jgi:tetratricopeptide (TPR) repeat protein